MEWEYGRVAIYPDGDVVRAETVVMAEWSVSCGAVLLHGAEAEEAYSQRHPQAATIARYQAMYAE